MSHRQQTFNPADFAFSWTPDGWYQWNRDAAHKAAMQARNAEAKRLRAKGCRVIRTSLPGQLISRGGIGSGHPHIEMFVTCYMVEAVG
jgi:hypothetical protein